MRTFRELKTYRANFTIQTVHGKSRKLQKGVCFYQAPDRLRYQFSVPAGNLMISDGKFLWIYIPRLRAVGRQDLQLDKKNESNNSIFVGNPGPGLVRLFRKYHYRFDSPKQPRELDGGSYFVLDMEQREKIGGYEKIKLHVDSKNYLVYKAVGSDGYGKTTTITFKNIKTDIPLEGKLFQYRPDDSVRVVSNPLVTD